MLKFFEPGPYFPDIKWLVKYEIKGGNQLFYAGWDAHRLARTLLSLMFQTRSPSPHSIRRRHPFPANFSTF